MAKKIYNYDSSGYYINSVNARIDPLESEKSNKNIYLLPANATFTKPPEVTKNTIAKWDGSKWLEEDKKLPDEAVKPTDEELFQIAKKDKLNEIYLKRQEYQYSNITYNDKEYINSITSQNKFFNLINNTDSNIEWRLSDSSWVTLNKDQISELKNLIIQREVNSYKEESRLINSINDTKKIEELKDINWEL
jgi:hypothetical protein